MQQRVLRATQATISIDYEINGTSTAPSPATADVTITRADGTPLVTDAPATHGTAGEFSYTLTPTETADLDCLTATWTSSLGTLTTNVEIVGGFLFTISEARSLSPLDKTAVYSTQQIIDARTLAETALEDLCGVAFVPRYTTETFSGNAGTQLLLRPRTSAIRSVSADGVAYTTTELTALVPQQTGLVYNPNRWANGYGNLTIGYEHGYTSPPPRVSQACLLLAKNWLVKGPLDDRMTSMSSEDGTFSLLTPGVRGSYVGIPEVDAVIQQYGLSASIA